MEKIVEIGILFDYYGKLLSDKQYNVVYQYCNEDLSLKEIAELNGVSKQGISDILNRSEKKLQFFENELKIIERLKKTNSILKEINELISNSNKKTSDDLFKLLDIIQSKNNEIIKDNL